MSLCGVQGSDSTLTITLEISGPGCANMMMWRDSHAKRFAVKAPLSRYSTMLTTHFYTKKSTAANVSHTTFLHEDSVSRAACR